MKRSIMLSASIILLKALTSCHSYMDITEPSDYASFQSKRRVYVMQLQTNQDSTIYFSKWIPGKISNGEVAGLRQVLMQDFHPDSVIFKEKNIMHPRASYVLKDGNRYRTTYLEDDILVCIPSDTTRIPFSEIKQMQIKKINHPKTALFVAGIAGGYAGFIYLLLSMAASNMSFGL